MRFYPAYKLREVLDMYATTFFTLLSDAYKHQARGYLLDSQITMLPYLKNDRDRQRFMDNLRSASQGFDAILETSEGTPLPELKKLLG